MLSRRVVAVQNVRWSRASLHTSYQHVQLAALSPEEEKECECYYNRVNDKLEIPLDRNVELPNQPPSYKKHVLLVSPGDVSEWGVQLEANKKWPYSAIGSLKESLKKYDSSIFVNAMSFAETEREDGVAQFYVFPDMAMYKVQPDEIGTFAQFLADGKKMSQSKLTFEHYLRGTASIVTQTPPPTVAVAKASQFKAKKWKQEKDWILICGHTQRDKRCGLIAQDLLRELHSRRKQYNVGIISHVGGHKFAGNIIVYRRLNDTPRRVDGLWFGKLVPSTLHAVLTNLDRGRIVDNFYRGGVALSSCSASSCSC